MEQPERQKRKRQESPESRYYRRVATGFRLAKYLCAVLLVLLGVMSATVWRQMLSYDTVRYVVRELDTNRVDLSEGFADATFEEQQNQSFRLYKENLAVAGKSRLTLLNTSGSETCSYPLNYDNPALYTSESLILAADLGGTAYSLYTTLACVEAGTTDHPITGVAMGRGGAYALITRSSSARYQLTVYSPERKKLATYFRDDYVFDAALSDDGKTVVILSGGVSESVFRTYVTVGAVGSSDTGSTVELSGMMPLCVRFFSDGNFCVVTDRAAVFFDGAGAELNRLTASEWSHTDFSGAYAVLAVPQNAVGSSHLVTVTDSRGNVLAEEIIDNRLKSVAAAEKGGRTLAYLLLPEEAVAWEADGTRRRASYSGSSAAIVAAGSFDYAILCRTTGAVAVLGGTK